MGLLILGLMVVAASICPLFVLASQGFIRGALTSTELEPFV
jgi:hypothetical protein